MSAAARPVEAAGREEAPTEGAKAAPMLLPSGDAGLGQQPPMVNGHHHNGHHHDDDAVIGGVGEEEEDETPMASSVIVIGEAPPQRHGGGSGGTSASLPAAVESKARRVEDEGCFENEAFEGDEAPPSPAAAAAMTTPPSTTTTTTTTQTTAAVADEGTPRGRDERVLAINGHADSMPLATLNVSGLMASSESEKADLESGGGGGMAEAVNLELVNMNPYGGMGVAAEDVDGKSTNGGLNGIPVKRGDEEMGGEGSYGDPYDEYFVPVNEHRKYIRGEKLYVTKDRRRSNSWRRCACWAVGLSLLAVAVLIAILAGTGIILSQEEPRGAVEGRALGAGIIGSIPRVAESTDQKAPSAVLPPTEQPPPSSFTPPPSTLHISPGNPPTTEMSALYVPRVLEAEMRIDSLDFTSELSNHSSSNFQRLARDLEAELKTALFDDLTMRNGPADVFIKVIGFRPGSVVATFHVGWRFRDSLPSPHDPIDAESLQDRLEAHLLKNGGYLYTYRVSSGSVRASNLMDVCQMDNGGCSHECRYDYQEALFACNCPPSLYLEQNGKNCSRDLMDSSVPLTEGPAFDQGPWMPMVPQEPEAITEEEVKALESSSPEPATHHAEGHDGKTAAVGEEGTEGMVVGGEEEEEEGGEEAVSSSSSSPPPDSSSEEEEDPSLMDRAQPTVGPSSSSVGTGRSGGGEPSSVWVVPSSADGGAAGGQEDEDRSWAEGYSPAAEEEALASLGGGGGQLGDNESAIANGTSSGVGGGASEGEGLPARDEAPLGGGGGEETSSVGSAPDSYDEYDVHVLPGRVVGVDSGTALSNATAEEESDDERSPPLREHIVVPAFEHVVVREESEGGGGGVTTTEEGVTDDAGPSEEGNGESSAELGAQGKPREGEGGGAEMGEVSSSQGAEAEDVVTTSVQDVNYVINHGESWSEKKGGGGGEAEGSTRPSPSLSGQEEEGGDDGGRRQGEAAGGEGVVEGGAGDAKEAKDEEHQVGSPVGGSSEEEFAPVVIKGMEGVVGSTESVEGLEGEQLGEGISLSEDAMESGEIGNGVKDEDWMSGLVLGEDETAGDVIVPRDHGASEDEDPNIVPVEEIPKETLVDLVDVKKKGVVPEIDVRLGGVEGNKSDAAEVNAVREEEGQVKSKPMITSDADNPGAAVRNQSVHEIIILNGTHSSQLENSIENLSDKYNSSYESSRYQPENDISAISSHFLMPVGAKNASSGNDKGNDFSLESQLPVTVSSSMEAITTATEAIDESTLSAVNDISTTPLDAEREQTNGSSRAAAGGETMKDEAGNPEMVLYSVSPVTQSLEHYVNAESDELMEKKHLSDDDGAIVGTTTELAHEEDVGLKDVEMVRAREGEVKSTEKPSLSIASSHLQDHVIEDPNTVYAANPTSPSSVLEETSENKGSVSDSALAPGGHGPIGDTTESSRGAEGVNHGSISLESDDSEQENNLASVDSEDAERISGEKDPLTGNGLNDDGARGTTEHTNEIVVASAEREHWPPSVLLGAGSVTKGGGVAEEGAGGDEDVEMGGHLFEVPVKKKGELKKPTHQEDDITKHLLFANKESVNKVEKGGLLPATHAMLTEGPKTIRGEEEADGSSTTTEVPLSSSEPSPPEASFSPVVPVMEKGGERLNVIGEGDSGGRKDVGMAVVKESRGRGDVGNAVEEKGSELPREEGAVDVVGGEEVEGSSPAGDEKNPSADGGVGGKTEVTAGTWGDGGMTTTERGETTIESATEEVQGGASASSTEGITIGSETTPMDSTEGTTTTEEEEEESMEATTTVVELLQSEMAHVNVEEMLKEMGGFGEGGHRVVAKTGVESPPPSLALPTAAAVTEREGGAELPSSTPSTSVASSTTSLPPLTTLDEVTTPTAPDEPVETSTVPLESETTTTTAIADDEVDGGVKNGTLQNADHSMNSMHTKGPIPTLMVHEVVTTHPDPPSNMLQGDSVVEGGNTTSIDIPEASTLAPEGNPTTALTEEGGGETSIAADKSTNGTLSNRSVNATASNSLSGGEKKLNDTEGLEVPGPSHFPELGDQHFPKCTSGQFQCANGTSLTPYSVIPISSSSSVASIASGAACVPLSAKCDSINDCSDGSDEVGCIEEGCPGNFQCSNGQCLKRHLVCNGIVDCNDGSDEGSCDRWQCQFDEYQCPSGRCIPSLWQCDGKPDCDNNTDEHNCQDSCGNDEYLCPERWCIPMSWRCNGVSECADGEDEKLCDCSLEQTKCSTGGCVARSEVCDGVDQCPDGSDEWSCSRLHNETMELEVRTHENEWLSVCADEWNSQWSDFICQNFGFSRAVFTEYPASGGLSNSSTVFTLKPGISSPESLPLQNGVRLPGMLQQIPSSTCSSGSIVAISCQEFTCGNHGLADGVAARLVGGGEAANGQWPSVALLYHTRQRAACTASIISPRWLIASYNCLHMREKSLSPDGWVAFGGGSTFDKDKPETQIKIVKSIVPYPQVKYNRFLYNHDVALIELVEPLTFTQSVGAICLPEKPIEPRQLCVTAGWGYTSPGEMNFSQYLHYLPVPTIELSECNSTKHYSGFITEDKICAGFTDAMHSPCYNDEGAPLMCVSDGSIWELHGVLSYHSNCGRGYHPSIFSSVTAVREWVAHVVGAQTPSFGRHSVRRRRSSSLSTTQ